MKQTYRVMVVDDEPIVRNAVASQVPWEEHGVEVITAANGIEALDNLEKK